MLGYYNVSVILTYFGLGSAVVGIRLATSGRISGAIVCLLISCICDMFDGKIARAIKRSEDAAMFGIQIDSLCDLVCFGVLPAVIAMSLGVNRVVGMATMVLYVLGAVIRLGYFNVNEMKRQQETSENRKEYQGLPVTTASWLIALFYLVGKYLFPEHLTPMLVGWMFILALAFVTDFRIKKPQGKTIYFVALGLLIVLIAVILILR